MKFAVSLFATFSIIVGAMLFMQYQVYSNQDIPTNEAFTYSQEIEITYRAGSLDIRHHFKNLPNDSLEIVWPALATDRNCFLETEYSCARLSEDKATFEAGENRTQSVSYIIPLEGGLTSENVVKNVYASLKNGDVKFSTVHISTESSVAGQWVTGLPLIGQQSLALVNYSMFSGNGQVYDLYWQQTGLALQKKTDALSIYANTDISAEISQAADELNRLSDEHIAIIAGNNIEVKAHRMLFLPQLSVPALQKEFMMAQVESQYTFVDSPLWLKHVVAMYLSGETFGTPRAQKIMEILTNQMTEEQLADWKKRLKELEGNVVSPEVLDKQLSAVLGTYTEYLSMNVDAAQTYPFMFHDKRKVYVNSVLTEDIDVVLYEGKVLYTADPLLHSIGYTTSLGPNGYYVNSDTRVFRFPENEHGFYVFNQRRYNTTTSPLSVVAGTYYIEESWLQRLFLINLQKDEQSVQITTTAQQ
ncbi:RNA polymerase II [Lysinibacillus sp. KU-BSD001]|uniref:RNA polymerase II n=1 Tax=Lysinibacillus sp. KU-BSD001 TaxID=3141328 RepID=UPI0036EAF8A1